MILVIQVCSNRKLKPKAETILKPGNLSVKCRCPKWHPNCSVKCPPWHPPCLNSSSMLNFLHSRLPVFSYTLYRSHPCRYLKTKHVFHVFKRQSYRARKTYTERKREVLSADPLSKWVYSPGLSQPKTRIQDFHVDFPCRYKGQKHLRHFPLFSQVYEQEMESEAQQPELTVA